MIKTKEELALLFETGDKPSQQDFLDLLDTLSSMPDIAPLERTINGIRQPQSFQPPNSPVVMSQNDVINLDHGVVTNEIFQIQILEEVKGVTGLTNTQLDFDMIDSGSYLQEDPGNTEFFGGSIRLKRFAGYLPKNVTPTLLLTFDGASRYTNTGNASVAFTMEAGYDYIVSSADGDCKTGTKSATSNNAAGKYTYTAGSWFSFSGDFTWCFWMRTPNITSIDKRLCGFAGSNSTQFHQNHQNLFFYYGNWDFAITVNPNVWTHIAVTRKGSTLYFFKNGILTATKTGVTGTLGSNTASHWVFNSGENAGFAGGYLDDYMVVKDYALFTENFSVVEPKVSDKMTFTTTPKYVATTDMNHFNIGTAGKINSLSITRDVPLGTSIKCLASFDGRQTWKKFDGSNWVAVSNINAVHSEGTNIDLFPLGFTNHIPVGEAYLDFAFSLQSTDVNISPSIDQITINYDDMSHYEVVTMGSYGSSSDYGIKRVSPTQTQIKKQSSGTGLKAFITMTI